MPSGFNYDAGSGQSAPVHGGGGSVSRILFARPAAGPTNVGFWTNAPAAAAAPAGASRIIGVAEEAVAPVVDAGTAELVLDAAGAAALAAAGSAEIALDAGERRVILATVAAGPLVYTGGELGTQNTGVYLPMVPTAASSFAQRIAQTFFAPWDLQLSAIDVPLQAGVAGSGGEYVLEIRDTLPPDGDGWRAPGPTVIATATNVWDFPSLADPGAPSGVRNRFDFANVQLRAGQHYAAVLRASGTPSSDQVWWLYRDTVAVPAYVASSFVSGVWSPEAGSLQLGTIYERVSGGVSDVVLDAAGSSAVAASGAADVVLDALGASATTASGLGELVVDASGASAISSSGSADVVLDAAGASAVAASGSADVVLDADGAPAVAAADAAELVLDAAGASAIAAAGTAELVVEITDSAALAAAGAADVVLDADGSSAVAASGTADLVFDAAGDVGESSGTGSGVAELALDATGDSAVVDSGAAELVVEITDSAALAAAGAADVVLDATGSYAILVAGAGTNDLVVDASGDGDVVGDVTVSVGGSVGRPKPRLKPSRPRPVVADGVVVLALDAFGSGRTFGDSEDDEWLLLVA